MTPTPQSSLAEGSPEAPKQLQDELERLRFRALLFKQARKSLARIAAQQPLQQLLDEVLIEVEQILPGRKATLLVVNPDGATLSLGSAPGMPDNFSEIIDNFLIGENMACCGSACHSGERQFCSDVRSDRRWRDFQQIGADLNVRACWSQPVVDPDGKVIASFSIYRNSPGLPGMEEEEMLASVADLAAIALYLDKSRRSLQQSDLLYREIFESNSAVKLVIDPTSGEIVRANPAAENFYGYPQAELEQMNISQINTLQPEEIIAAMMECHERKKQHYTFMHRLHSGETRQVEVFSGPVQLDGRELIFSIIHDISERVAAETALKESQQRYEFVMKGSLDGFWDWDPHTGKGWWSPRFKELIGIQEDSNSVNLFEIMHPDDLEKTQKNIHEHLAHDVPYDIEYRLRHLQTGEYRWFHARGQAFRDPQGKAVRVSGSVRDIQGEKDLLERRRRMEERLQYTQRLESMAVLTGGIAHDFNNFLTSILGSAAMIRERVREQTDPEQQLARIEAAAFSAADLCKKLLAYAGKGPRVVETIFFDPLVSDMVGMLRSAHPKIHWQVECGASSEKVSADPSQLRQVVLNLLTNAAESLQDPGGEVVVRTGRREFGSAELRSALPDGEMPSQEYIFLEVHDRGLGMDPLTRERMFEPFYSTKADGRGLGMASVLGNLGVHKGGILVQSKPGEGSSFCVLLPPLSQSHQADLHVNAVAKTSQSIGPPSASHPLLVVDDQVAVRELLVEMLEHFGFDVVAVASGEQAIQLLENGTGFSGVVLDLTMPGMDGADTCQALIALQPSLPVVLASGYGAENLEAKLTPSQREGILRKPFTLAGLSKGLQAAGIQTATCD
jgi:PAS domain S-box-containing protein